MSDEPAAPNPPVERSKWLLIAVIMILVLLILAWPIKNYFYAKGPKASVPELVDLDPLCQYMQTLQLNCVVAPAAEGVLGPGHFVAYSTTVVPRPKVPFPNGDLLSDACAVPGAKADQMRTDMLAELNKQAQKNTLAFKEITFKLDRAFQAGADLPVPRLANLKLKAGPKLTEVQDISLKMPHGWLKIIDENQFIDLLSGAAIQQRCIDRVIEKEYSVVSKAAIAQDYDIVVTEKAGQSFGLSAAVTKGEITMDAGGDARSAIDETIKQNVAIPVVVGVDFFDPELFKQNRARLVSPIFSSTGTANVTARALSPQGDIIWETSHTAALGQSLNVQQTGGGFNNMCLRGASSTVALNGSLVPARPSSERPESLSFEFSASGKIVGGQSQSPRGLCQAEPAVVETKIFFDSVVETIVRSDHTTILEVQFNGTARGQVKVRDWTGRELVQKPVEDTDNKSLIRFPLVGVGVYQVQVSGNRGLSASGPTALMVNEHAAFNISLH